MCMHAQEVFFFSNKIYKKASNVLLKMVVKELFSLQNVMKKLFEMHYSIEKNCLQVPKMLNPPDKKIMVLPLDKRLVVDKVDHCRWGLSSFTD